MEPGGRARDSTGPTAGRGPGVLKLFVYGTLKRGFRNHDRFCRGFLEVREAQVRGRLYDGPGYPFLEVPDEDVLALGTSRPLDDVVTQERVGDQARPFPGLDPASIETGAWGLVYGELIYLDFPERRLPAIDGLEGFRPGNPSLYLRVLVPVAVDGACEIAWTYVVADACTGQRRLHSGRWPERPWGGRRLSP